jgi:hypothetical protein
MAEAIIEAIRTVIDGGEVSDFMESFSSVRGVIDLVAGRDSLREYLESGAETTPQEAPVQPMNTGDNH